MFFPLLLQIALLGSGQLAVGNWQLAFLAADPW